MKYASWANMPGTSPHFKDGIIGLKAIRNIVSSRCHLRELNPGGKDNSLCTQPSGLDPIHDMLQDLTNIMLFLTLDTILSFMFVVDVILCCLQKLMFLL